MPKGTTMIKSLGSMKGDIYLEDSLVPILTSITLFSLYAIATLMETNMVMKDIGLGDQAIKPGKLIYATIASYFIWFLRTSLSIVVLWGLLTIIRVGIRTVIAIFKSSTTSDIDLANIVVYNTKNNIFWTLGIYLVDSVLLFFCAYAPMLLFFIMIPYCTMIYNYRAMKIQEQQQNDISETQGTLNTMHHHIMMIMSIIVVMVIITVTLRYIKEYDSIHIKTNADISTNFGG
jgi:hypothetical protein